MLARLKRKENLVFGKIEGDMGSHFQQKKSPYAWFGGENESKAFALGSTKLNPISGDLTKLHKSEYWREKLCEV